MGFRFRRSVKIAPGVKLNLNKKSQSVTLGGKLGRVTLNSSGRTTVGSSIPGTGIYYTETIRSPEKETKGSRTTGNGIVKSLLKKPWIIAPAATLLLVVVAAYLMGDFSKMDPAAAETTQINISSDERIDALNASDLAARIEPLVDRSIAHVTSSGTTATVRLVSDFDTEALPEDWDELTESLAAATKDKEGGYNVVISLEAADGTVLATTSQGRVLYDIVARREEAAREAQKVDLALGEYKSTTSHAG